MAKERDVLLEVRDGIAWITINRPEKLNAFRWETIEQLTAAFREVEKDSRIGVSVLTGAGDRAFSVGGDVQVLSKLDAHTGREWNSRLLELAEAIRGSSKPVIAMVNGYAIGGGNELNLLCDLSIAAEDAKLGQAGPIIGGCPLWGATQLLPLLVGEKRARELVYLCYQYTAHEAERMGWINKVVPRDGLRSTVEQWARRILEMAPQSIRLAKASLNYLSDLTWNSFRQGSELLTFVWESEQFREGTTAFLEKRRADFARFRS